MVAYLASYLFDERTHVIRTMASSDMTVRVLCFMA